MTFQRIKNSLKHIWDYLTRAPGMVPLLFLVGFTIFVISFIKALTGQAVPLLLGTEFALVEGFKLKNWLSAIHVLFEYDFIEGDISGGNAFQFYSKQFGFSLICFLPAYILAWFSKVSRNVLVLLALLALALFTYGLPWDIHRNWRGATISQIGEPVAFRIYLIKLFLVSLLVLSIPMLYVIYRKFTTLMDRYVVNNILVPLLMCSLGMISILFIFDFADNLKDFNNASASFMEIISYYVIQIPQMVVMVLPVALMLSILYCLTKMSKSNELISMLGSGISMVRILTPIFFVGLVATFICTVFNIEWAPWAEGNKKAYLRKINDDLEQKTAAVSQLYMNVEDDRLWYIGSIPYDIEDEKLRHVEIYQNDETGKLQKAYISNRVSWQHWDHQWRLFNLKTVEYDDDGQPIPGKIEKIDKMSVPGWKETPWKIFSSSLNPDHLGIQKLTSYLNANEDLPEKDLAYYKTERLYRWSLPWHCLVITLIAAPLGVVYSRRGVVGSVATSVMLFGVMTFTNNLMTAFAKASYISPFVGAWVPNIIFALIGILFIWLRSHSREIPTIQSMVKNIFRRQSSGA